MKSFPEISPSTSGSPACAVLVLSCDRYRDLWPSVTTLFNRYWPDCPWPKYLASDLAPPAYAGFSSLSAGSSGLDWSSVLQRVLAQLPSDHVLLFLDDFFLTAPADTNAVRAVWAEMLRLRAGHVRLVPHARLLRVFAGSELLGEHIIGLPYRACLQAGFWRRGLLMALLAKGESPWQFEVAGSLRSETTTELFLAAWRNPVPYVDVLERGKWLPRGVRLVRREGLVVNFSTRPAISVADRVRRCWSQVFACGVHAVPREWRRRVRALRQANKTGPSS